MHFVFIVTSSHLNNTYNAIKLAREILAQQHTINCIYFLFDGVYNANQNIDMPTDEPAQHAAWSRFATEFNLALRICTASGLRRGVVENCLAAGFSMGSIGQLVESCDTADRVIRL
jgi:tRNA 2-thiouridine synthesizing protein D